MSPKRAPDANAVLPQLVSLVPGSCSTQPRAAPFARDPLITIADRIHDLILCCHRIDVLIEIVVLISSGWFKDECVCNYQGACLAALQGSCPSDPSSTLQGAADLPDRNTPTQCVLRIPAGILATATLQPSSAVVPRLWLDNLLLTTGTGPAHSQQHRTTNTSEGDNATAASPAGDVQLTISRRSEAWLTNVVLDSGSGDAMPARGIDVQAGASLYARSALQPLSFAV